MAYDDAWAALNLEMPDRIPRTEYSVAEHWSLIESVTGVKARQSDAFEKRMEAGRALMAAWDFGLIWNVLVINQYYKGDITQMGHAAWAADGSDFDGTVTTPFQSPDEVLAYDPLAIHGLYEQSRLISDFEAG